MAGKKGRSGRKARTDGITMRAVALYIPMMRYEDMEDKERFRPEPWFLQFKRVFGSQWQEKVRSMMIHRINSYQDNQMWKCDWSLEESAGPKGNGRLRMICKNCGKTSCRRKREHKRPHTCYCMCLDCRELL
jgi:hypothetical protein